MNRPHEQSDSGIPSAAFSAEISGAADIAVCLPSESGRLADYAQLTKFRLSLLVLVVTAAGYWFSAGSRAHIMPLFNVVFGTALVAFAANAGNQIMERSYDRLMRRTSNRPIPAGRIPVGEAIGFTIASAALGASYLFITVNSLASILALSTLGLYLIVYTPLKRVTALNTVVGAIPGALPPVIGVVAAQGTLTIDAGLLFTLLFFWQLPHFFSIAWLYREDYARGGYRMLSVVDPGGASVSRQSVVFQVCTILASVMPAFIGRAGIFYLMGAGALGYGLLICTIRFALGRNRDTARTLLLATIAYLPLLLGLLLADRILG